MNSVWSKIGNSFTLDEISHQQESLQPGVYRLEFNKMRGIFYLDHVQDKFTFPYKIYGVETAFVKRVKKTWSNTLTNMGILLNGLKGTGKTVTAELICNELNIPVILVQKHYPGLVSFLNSVQQEIIVFIDEYEKIYNQYDNSLLSVMDGAFRTDSRKLFLLTTNELKIDRNMLQRPSRIRYIKSYNDLTLDVIMEVVEDKLIHPELKQCTIEMISELPIITMDLVKSVIEEVNIHHEDPALFKDYFNVQGDQSDIYNVYMLEEDGSKKLFAKQVTVTPYYMSQYEEGEMFFVQRQAIGVISKVLNRAQVLVNMDVFAETLEELKDITAKLKDDEEEVVTQRLFMLEAANKRHKAFYDAAF